MSSARLRLTTSQERGNRSTALEMLGDQMGAGGVVKGCAVGATPPTMPPSGRNADRALSHGSEKALADAQGASPVLVFQPALPSYRLGFFSRVHAGLGGRLRVFYSSDELGVLTERAAPPTWATALGPMLRPLPGVEWQVGALSQPIRRDEMVVVSGAPRGLSNLLLLLKARMAGALTIWWGQYWSSTSHPVRFAIRMVLMRLANAVIFYTDDEVTAYRDGPGRNDRRPVFALNNGVDLEPIAIRRVPYRALERGHEVLFLGRLTEKAQVGLLIEAMAESILADIVVHIVGDGHLRDALQQKARNCGVDTRIHWHGGTTDEDRIAKIANRCRLFVYPGAVGLSLIHAMAYGLPVVVHGDRRRHMPEIAAFQEGVTGKSFADNDASDLSRCIHHMLSDARLLGRFSQNSLEITETRFNTAVMTERFMGALSSLRKAGSHGC